MLRHMHFKGRFSGFILYTKDTFDIIQEILIELSEPMEYSVLITKLENLKIKTTFIMKLCDFDVLKIIKENALNSE